jgi:hypothetical protein
MANTDTSRTPTDQDNLICVACGTEFDQPADQPLENCVICDVSKPVHVSNHIINQPFDQQNK